jgi:hypothetical protein
MPNFKVGQTIIAKIGGIPQEATIRTVLETTEGIKLIVDFGHEQTATVPRTGCCEKRMMRDLSWDTNFEYVDVEELRERLQRMSEKELLRFGKAARSLIENRLRTQSEEPWRTQLEEAKKE